MMHPSKAMKHIYAALAEHHTSCGSMNDVTFYEDIATCGPNTSSTYTTTPTANQHEDGANNKNVSSINEHSLEVGLRTDREVFDPPSSTGEQLFGESLLDHTLPVSSSSPANVTEVEEQLSIVNNDEGDNEDDGSPTLPSLTNVREGTSGPTLVMKKNRFVESSVSSSNKNDIAPPDVDADNDVGIIPHIGYCPSDEGSTKNTNNNMDKKKFPSDEDLYHTNTIINSTNKLDTNKKSHLVATPTMFTNEELNQITPLQISMYLTNKERKLICTKVLNEKLSSSKEEGKEYSLVSSGGSKKQHTCDECGMPLLLALLSTNKQDGGDDDKNIPKKEAECVICPVLKKEVLKKILGSYVDSSSSVHSVANSTAETTAASTISSKSMTAYEFDCVHDTNVTTATTTKSKNGNDKSMTNGIQDQDESRFFSKELSTYYSNIKTSFNTSLNTLNCNSHQVELHDFVEEARQTLEKKIELASNMLKSTSSGKCHEADFIESTGELVLDKVTLLPDAMKIAESNHSKNGGSMDASCKGLEFDEVKNTLSYAATLLTKSNGVGEMKQCTTNAVEMLTTNVQCGGDVVMEYEGMDANDLVETDACNHDDKKFIGLGDTFKCDDGCSVADKAVDKTKSDADISLLDQDDIIVEDVSEAAYYEQREEGKETVTANADADGNEDSQVDEVFTEIMQPDQVKVDDIATQAPCADPLPSTQEDQPQSLPSSSDSVNPGERTTDAYSLTSNTSAVSKSVLSLAEQIEQLRDKSKTKDLEERIRFSGLLVKSRSATLTLKEAEQA